MFIIDIGANHGEFALEIAKRNRSHHIVAIEPVGVLGLRIKEKARCNTIDNIEVIECAIDEIERVATLNMSTHSDWGVSSLLNFDEEKLKDEYWKTRDDMYFDEQIEVPVRRLSTLCEELEVSQERRIDFIKIDAQGLDLQVLMSAGEYIQFIDAGMLEVSANTSLGLYKDEAYNMQSVLNWLDCNGFSVYYIKPNDPASNEFNIYFIRKGNDYLKLEEQLSLRGVNIYDGKFYWHFSSPSLLSIEHDYHILNNELISVKAELSKKEEIIITTDNILKKESIGKENHNLQIRRYTPWLSDVNELIVWIKYSRIMKVIRWFYIKVNGLK
ncbi:hypothetical protein A9266_20995 [Vibrio tasmaniensis]|nr:hypothetical protein A9266_20995 [Vibrio tasmaniensis]